MGFIAGKYSMTYNALAAGQTNNGIRVSHQFFKRLITGDNYGQAKQDGVYQGADMFLATDLMEYNAAALATMIWPYSATMWDMGVIGRLDVASSIVKQIVLTALAGTTAATVPATMTLPRAILIENFPIELLLAPDLREVPWRGRVYPGDTGIFGTQT